MLLCLVLLGSAALARYRVGLNEDKSAHSLTMDLAAVQGLGKVGLGGKAFGKHRFSSP